MVFDRYLGLQTKMAKFLTDTLILRKNLSHW